jgi:Bacterial inner membrane protein
VTSTGDPFSATQLVGYAATFVSLSAYALREDKMMKTGVGLGLVLWALHYAMLSAWTASATCLLIASRQILAFIAPLMSAAARRATAASYCLIFTCVLWQTWAGPVSLLPWISALNATYAYFYLAGTRLRAQVMLSTGLWLLNALALSSIGGVAMNTASLGISLWTIIRLKRAATAL